MNIKYYTVIFIFLLVIGLFIGNFITSSKKNLDNKEIQVYQGPVPEGYDEKYFRETGITKPLEELE